MNTNSTFQFTTEVNDDATHFITTEANELQDEDWEKLVFPKITLLSSVYADKSKQLQETRSKGDFHIFEYHYIDQALCPRRYKLV